MLEHLFNPVLCFGPEIHLLLPGIYYLYLSLLILAKPVSLYCKKKKERDSTLTILHLTVILISYFYLKNKTHQPAWLTFASLFII